MRTLVMIAAAALLCAGCDRIRNAVAPPPEYDGASLVIEIDASAAVEQHLHQMSDQMAGALRTASIRYNGRGVADGAVRVRLVDAADAPRALEALAPITGHMTLTAQPDGLIEARLNDAYVASTADQLAQGSIPILQRRLDERVAHVEAHEPGRLIIRTTEDAVPQSVHNFINRQGRLTFNLVREVSPEYVAVGRLPAGTMLVEPFEAGMQSEVVESQPALTAQRLVGANPSTDPQTAEFVLSFQLDAEGTRIFCRITREHTGERFAVLLDNKVLTASHH